MAHFYFTRHGQSVWNVENKICGATDIALTQQGEEQAKALGAQIKKERLKIDEILYSPLIRAAETARYIAEICQIPTKPEDRLREQNFGKYEGTERGGVLFHEAKKSFANRFGGGESMLLMAQRVYNLIDDLKKEPEKVRLLVAHSGIIRIIESYFTEMTNEEFASFGIGNCTLVKYEL